MKIKAQFNDIEIIQDFKEELEFYNLDFNGCFLVEINRNLELTGNAIDGYGYPINPRKYLFNCEILEGEK